MSSAERARATATDRWAERERVRLGGVTGLAARARTCGGGAVEGCTGVALRRDTGGKTIRGGIGGTTTRTLVVLVNAMVSEQLTQEATAPIQQKKCLSPIV